MKILSFVLLLFCAGCYQIVDHSEIKKAEFFCKECGGVAWIKEDIYGNTKFQCLNGDRALESEIILPKPYNQ